MTRARLDILVALRTPVQCSIDAMCWVTAMWIANAARYDLAPGQLWYPDLLVLMGVAAVLQVAFGAVFHLYRGRYRFGSFEEVAGVLLAVGSTAVATGVTNLVLHEGTYLVPRSVPAT